MRLVMIMGYGEVKFRFDSSSETARTGDNEKDGGEGDLGGEDGPPGAKENKRREETVPRRVRRGGGQ
jgi:hypothetical protein